MDKPQVLSSAQNPKIQTALKLRSKRTRTQLQLFLIEGYRELTYATQGGAVICELFYSPSHFLGSSEGDLIEKVRAQGSAIYEVKKKLFDKLSYRDRGDGLIAVAKQQHLGLCALEKITEAVTAPFFVVAEAIEKPGNLGSILRSSDAAGVDALLLCDPRTDVHNPNVVRASTGTLFTVPVVELSKQTALEFLHKKGVTLVASSPSASLSFTEAKLTGSIAIAVGTEQLGLSQEWLHQAKMHVRIPMFGQCDSLNVAAATTLLLYEVVRQRS